MFMTKTPDFPANVTSLDLQRAKRASTKDDMFDLLANIDELEEALETMDEHGLKTREELESLIAELERRAEDLDKGK